MHTTKQARALWCPMARVGLANSGVVALGQSVLNRLQDGDKTAIPEASKCISDLCAMWRWEHTTKSVPVPGENGATCYEQRVVRTHGYCGLSPLSAN